VGFAQIFPVRGLRGHFCGDRKKFAPTGIFSLQRRRAADCNVSVNVGILREGLLGDGGVAIRNSLTFVRAQNLLTLTLVDGIPSWDLFKHSFSQATGEQLQLLRNVVTRSVPERFSRAQANVFHAFIDRQSCRKDGPAAIALIALEGVLFFLLVIFDDEQSEPLMYGLSGYFLLSCVVIFGFWAHIRNRAVRLEVELRTEVPTP
jgi:hypothetical protein